MCKALRAGGVSAVVATTDADGAGRLPVGLGRVETYGDVPVIFFRRSLSESFKWSWRLGTWLRQHVPEFDLAHIHAVFSHSSIVAGRVCREKDVPYIVRPLGTLDPWSVNRKRARKQVLLRLGAGDLLSGAAAMHYTSAEEMRLAETVVPDLPNGVVVPLGVDDAVFVAAEAPRPTESAPYVLALSRLDIKKGVDLLIQAFLDLARDARFQGWRLVIAGDGDPAYVSTLRELAQDGDASSRIEFRGWVGTGEKVILLRGASVFALLSHQENFGLSMVEAMACGTPVLVTPGVNLASDIEAAGAGWVVERTPAAIVDSLRVAMTDPAERERRGRAGRRLAGQYRWADVAQRLGAMYADVAAKAPRTAVGV